MALDLSNLILNSLIHERTSWEIAFCILLSLYNKRHLHTFTCCLCNLTQTQRLCNLRFVISEIAPYTPLPATCQHLNNSSSKRKRETCRSCWKNCFLACEMSSLNSAIYLSFSLMKEAKRAEDQEIRRGTLELKTNSLKNKPRWRFEN